MKTFGNLGPLILSGNPVTVMIYIAIVLNKTVVLPIRMYITELTLCHASLVQVSVKN